MKRDELIEKLKEMPEHMDVFLVAEDGKGSQYGCPATKVAVGRPRETQHTNYILIEGAWQ